MRAKLSLKIFIFAIAVSGVLGYAYSRTSDLIKGPRIEVTEPKNGAAMYSSLASVQGNVKNAAKIFFNGRPISVDERGAFQEYIYLAKGYNVLQLRAEDRFGRIETKKIEVVRR